MDTSPVFRFSCAKIQKFENISASVFYSCMFSLLFEKINIFFGNYEKVIVNETIN